jgi:predicted permease
MSWWKGARARLHSMRRGAAEARIQEEFRFHVEMETEQNIRLGMAPSEARRRALVAFGGADRYDEGMRDGRGVRWVSDVVHDVRFAVRGMARAPVFTAVACVTIGLGVGVTTALFSLTNALLLRPLPVSDPHELFALQEHRSGRVSTGIEGWRMPYSRYLEYREALADRFEGLAAQRLADVSLRVPNDDAAPATTLLISPNYFDVLRVQPVLGRLPAGDDEAVAVLGYGAWQERFGGAADAVGRVVHVNGRPFTISAVAPAGFGGTTFGMVPELWIPHGAYVASAPIGSDEQWVAAFGRLAAGVPVRVAESAADAAGRRIPEEGVTVHRVELEPFTGLPGEGRRIAAQFMALLLGAAGLVLAIASANIAGMLLARAVARRREIAVRLALGAGRPRLIRQLLTESIVLFLVGGALGVLLAYGLTHLLSTMPAPAPGLRLTLVATPDVRVLAFALVISLVPAIVFGLLPAVRSTRPDLVPALKEGAAGGGRSGTRLRSVFVVGQLAMAVLLLISGGLFLRTLQHGRSVHPGFDAAGVFVASVNIAPHGYDSSAGRLFYEQLTQRVEVLPFVESVALASVVMLAGNRYSSDVRADEAPAETRAVNAAMNFVDEAFLSTMRIPLLEGRGFGPSDGADAERVAIVNETLARRLWPDAGALDRVIRSGSAHYRVIGVVRDGKYVTVGEDPLPFMFLPYAQHYSGHMSLHVRSTGSAATVLPAVREQLRALDPNIAVEYEAPLPEIVKISLFPQRFAGTMIGALGLLGLLLAAVGTYGLLMYSVSQRIRDWGVRIALGASAADVTRGVLLHGLTLTAAGIILGLAGAALLTRALRGFIFGIGPYDPVTFVAVPVVLTAVGLLAAWQPVRRALRADPVQALRAD